MTRSIFIHVALFTLISAVTPLLIVGGAAAQVIGVRIAAEFHDEIVNSWPAGGVNEFKLQARKKLISRLRGIFNQQDFAPASDVSEYVLEIKVDPGELNARVADYAFWMNIRRLQQGRQPTNVNFGLIEPDWREVYPSSPEEASAAVSQSIIRYLGRRSADFSQALASLKGQRLPIAIKITDFENTGNFLSQGKMMIEPVRPVQRAAYESVIDVGRFPDYIELPQVGHSYQAELRMEPRTGNNNANSAVVTKLCLRAAAKLTGLESLVELRCPYGEHCALEDADSVKQWVRGCRPDTGWHWPGLIGAAHAQPAIRKQNFWYAPSLSTLRERRQSGDIRGVGYTVFTVQADKLASLDADAFTYQVTVNGTPVHISGVPARSLIQSFDPEYGFELQFGLENHYFRGDQLGCDVIGVELSFMKNHKPAGQPIQLKRPYIALRDATPYQDPNWSYPFKWSGRYKMPRENWEYELFIGEDNFNWVPPGSRASVHETVLEKALGSQRRLEKRMQWNRQWIDKNNIPGPSNTRLVGVLRPPLSIKPGPGVKKLAYGIALGLEDMTSGQIFFTFTESQRDAHKAFFERKFAKLKNYSGNDPRSRKLKKAIGNFEKWLGSPTRWRKYQIGSNDAPTPPGFCESLPANQ